MMKRLLLGLTGLLTGLVSAAIYWICSLAVTGIIWFIFDDVLPRDYWFQQLITVTDFILFIAVSILMCRLTKKELTPFKITFIFSSEVVNIVMLFMFAFMKYAT